MAPSGSPLSTPLTSALARLQLRHLHCFLAVARLGSLRRAAETLSVTQPAVTKTVAELEDILGVRLFHRGRRGAVLTPEAEVFMRHAEAVVSGAGEAVRSVAAERARVPLTLGGLPTLTPSFLPQVLTGLSARLPTLAVRVVTGRNRQLLEQLQQRELDAVVGRLAEPEHMVGLSFEHLYAEPLAVAVRAGHPLLARGRLQMAELGAYDLVVPLPGTIIRHAVDGLLATHGVTPRRALMETLSSSLGRQLALGSDALWFTPLGAAEPDLAAGTLVRLPVTTTGTEEPVGLVTRTDTLPSAGLQALIAAVRRQAVQRRTALR